MIIHLPPQVIDKVRTGIGISNYTQALRALIENALDAGPSHILIEIDIQNDSMSVADDGIGILAQDLCLVRSMFVICRELCDRVREALHACDKCEHS